MLLCHHKAMDDIILCRTVVMGGQVFWCDACKHYQYAYDSCGNRHCPTCGDDRDAGRHELHPQVLAARAAQGLPKSLLVLDNDSCLLVSPLVAIRPIPNRLKDQFSSAARGGII
jgi:hypothetical protein